MKASDLICRRRINQSIANARAKVLDVWEADVGYTNDRTFIVEAMTKYNEPVTMRYTIFPSRNYNVHVSGDRDIASLSKYRKEFQLKTKGELYGRDNRTN